MLETERLIIRKFEKGDAPFILELLNTNEWKQFIGDRGVNDIATAEKYIQNLQNTYEQDSHGLYHVSLKENETPIGMSGILKRKQLEHPDLAFAFLPAFFGKGFAFEVGREMIHFAQKEFQFKQLYAITIAENKSCISLLEKLGFAFVKPISYENEILLQFEKMIL